MRKFSRRLRFVTALIVVLSMSALNFNPAMAGLAPSQTSGVTSITSARDGDMLVVQRALENRIVAQKLRDYGVAAADVQLKLADMSDRDLHTLARSSAGLPSGGDGTGAVIGILVVVILVIVILRLMNREVVVR